MSKACDSLNLYWFDAKPENILVRVNRSCPTDVSAVQFFVADYGAFRVAKEGTVALNNHCVKRVLDYLRGEHQCLNKSSAAILDDYLRKCQSDETTTMDATPEAAAAAAAAATSDRGEQRPPTVIQLDD
jgi:hypothetical protein